MAHEAEIRQFSLDHLPAFYAQVEQAFAFLQATYDCRLHAKQVVDLEESRDTRTSIAYLGKTVEVDINWDMASANMKVVLVELLVPRVSPAKRYIWGKVEGAARMADVHTLAELAGNPNDPDFLLRRVMKSDRRDTARRFKVLQSDFEGVIAGLARATERYARDVLRGDISVFTEAIALTTQQMHAQGFC